jgi:erythromycin esterase-like protein
LIEIKVEPAGSTVVYFGFGTDRGTVAAASDWDGPMEIKRVRPDLAEPLFERAIGVIYRPETELLSHYFQAELSRQFDAWIWFTETSAVAAQEIATYAAGPDETYPSGL